MSKNGAPRGRRAVVGRVRLQMPRKYCQGRGRGTSGELEMRVRDGLRAEILTCVTDCSILSTNWNPGRDPHFQFSNAVPTEENR